MRQRLNGGATWLGGTIRSILHAHLFQVVLIPTTSLRPSLLTIAGRRASKSCPTSSSGDGGRSITFPARTRIEARRAAALRSDNGPEFVAGTLLKWMADQGIEPRWSPRQALNGVAESFNGKLRDELSSLVWPDLSVSEGFVSRAGGQGRHRSLAPGNGLRDSFAYPVYRRQVRRRLRADHLQEVGGRKTSLAPDGTQLLPGRT